MNAYFIELAGPTIGPILGLAALILVLGIAIWVAFLVVRRFRSGLFVSGNGRGRLPRLAVTDAVPVDSHRRLILVRRDDVEHLIMIGGPTDIVVEAGIGKTQIAVQQPAPRLPIQPAQPQAEPQQRPATQAAREAVADAERGRPVRVLETQLPERRTEPVEPPPARPANLPNIQPPIVSGSTPHTVQVASRSDLDLDKLLDELRPNPLQDR